MDKKNIGSSAGALALLAFMVHLVSAPPSEKTQEPRPAHSTREILEPKHERSPEGEEHPKAGPWLAAQAFFHSEPDKLSCTAADQSAACRSVRLSTVADLEACSRDAQCGAQIAKLFGSSSYHPQFIIATIPDPLHTRLALSTDTSINAVKQGAFDSHWEFATQWLPWRENSTGGRESADGESSDGGEREKQPGLMVFRHGLTEETASDGEPQSKVMRQTGRGVPRKFSFDPEVLLVFLVGETPTAGINAYQFRAARAYMRALLGDPRDVRIVGPTFSGSFFSLRQLISEERASVGGNRMPKYYIRTGTATDWNAMNAFMTFGGPAETTAFRENVDFHADSENNDEKYAQLLDVIRDLRISPSEAAVVVEDESGLGAALVRGAMSKSQDKILRLRFPRDISHLRNTYHDVNSNTGIRNTAQPEVDFSLKDTASGGDSVPIFSATQTPVLQNAILGSITSEIKRRRIRLVDLEATNVLDQLFLAQVIHHQCPDTRILVTSPDLLFVQATQTQSLGGLLALSTYPLFPAAKLWMGDDPTVTHSGVNEEGIYNAVRSLLLPAEQWSKDIAWEGQKQPSSWLLTLARPGFSPIKLMRNHNPESGWFPEVPNSTAFQFKLPDPPAFWFIGTNLLAAVSVMLCGWILFLERDDRALPWDLLALGGNHIADAYRLICLACALLSLAAIQSVFYIPYLVEYVRGLPRDPPVGRLTDLIQAVGILLSLTVAIFAIRKALEKPRNSAVRYFYAAAPIGMTLAFFLVWTICCLRSNEHAGFLFSFRAVELTIGASPSLPVLLLLMSFFVFSLFHMVRFSLAINQRPRMFTAALDQFLKGKMRNCRRDLNHVLVTPMNLKPRQQAALVTVAIAALAVLMYLSDISTKLSSNEGRLYDALILGSCGLLVTVIAGMAIQATMSWAALRPMLLRLQLLPLGHAFTALKEGRGHGPIWAKRLNLQSLDIPIRASVVLHDLHVAALEPSWPQGIDLTAQEIEGLLRNYWKHISRLIGEREEMAEVSEQAAPLHVKSAAVGADSPVAHVSVHAEPSVTSPVQTGPARNAKLLRATQRREFGKLRYCGAAIGHRLTEQIIVPEWKKRTLAWEPFHPQPSERDAADISDSKEPRKDPYRLAETFVALQFSMFINYGVRQIQNLVFAVSIGFALFVVALNIYHFQAPQAINSFLLVSFAALGFVFWRILSQIERDPILSRMSGSTEGELNREFYLKVIGYGALPAFTLLTSVFPALGNFLSSWVQPSLEAIR